MDSIKKMKIYLKKNKMDIFNDLLEIILDLINYKYNKKIS
jgi:hypothetical protein